MLKFLFSLNDIFGKPSFEIMILQFIK